MYSLILFAQIPSDLLAVRSAENVATWGVMSCLSQMTHGPSETIAAAVDTASPPAGDAYGEIAMECVKNRRSAPVDTSST